MSSQRSASRLKTALLLSSSYLAAAIITGLFTRSLALFSEAGHMLADVGALALAIFAINYTQKPPTPQRTYGFYRIEILASLINSLLLILLSFYILYEGFRRIFAPPEIISFPMLIVAAIGLVMNFIAMRLLGSSHEHVHSSSSAAESGEEYQNEKQQHIKADRKAGRRDAEESLNIKAAYLETLSDTLGALGVMAAGIIMLFTKFYLADPIISIGLALFMLPRTMLIIRKAIHILMEGAPPSLSHEEIKQAILQIRGVTGVFELHLWTITSNMHALSAHVVIIDQSKSQAILQEINSTLEKKFKITHATIQIEKYHSESSGVF